MNTRNFVPKSTAVPAMGGRCVFDGPFFQSVGCLRGRPFEEGQVLSKENSFLGNKRCTH